MKYLILITLLFSHTIYAKESSLEFFEPNKANAYQGKLFFDPIKEEYPIGNYTGQKYAKMQVSHRERRQIVDLIEKLHKLQQYKPESLYLATSIADRYMINQAVSGK